MQKSKSHPLTVPKTELTEGVTHLRGAPFTKGQTCMHNASLIAQNIKNKEIQLLTAFPVNSLNYDISQTNSNYYRPPDTSNICCADFQRYWVFSSFFSLVTVFLCK